MAEIDEIKVFEPGTIAKAAEIEQQDVTEDELKKINRYTLSPLKADEVFTFKTYMGDNETDDRNFEPFNLQALKDLRRLYPGKTIIKDHRRLSDNQIARVYDTELEIDENKRTKAGEPFARLISKNYMIRTRKNEDLIREIQGGIRKEVSTGMMPKKLVCNICGADNMKTYCPHWPGAIYDKEGTETACMMTIDGAKEDYELSLVAVPAQPRAGAVKHYGPKPPIEEPGEVKEAAPEEPQEQPQEIPEEIPEAEEASKDLETSLRARALESFIFTQNN